MRSAGRPPLSNKQRQRLHRLADLGGLVTIAGLDAYPPDFLLGLLREECLERLILFGERRLIRARDAFVAHYHGERNHQGLGNDLIAPDPHPVAGPHVRWRERMGGLLRYDHRAA